MIKLLINPRSRRHVYNYSKHSQNIKDDKRGQEKKKTVAARIPGPILAVFGRKKVGRAQKARRLGFTGTFRGLRATAKYKT